jgi:BirA family biotin operon repressor/biotin-[acetyl-CoA-carboxylase] ligase
VALARAGEPEGYVLLADHQSAGRGRMTRSWEAPPRSSVTFSVLLRPAAPRTGVRVDPARWGWLPLVGGLAVVDALRHVCGLQAVLKWPNDVLVPDAGMIAPPSGAPAGAHRCPPRLRKVSGVLAEAVADKATGTPTAVVLGIGINVDQADTELPVDTATSLRLAGSAVIDRDTVARAVLRALDARYREWCEAGGDPDASGIARDYRSASATIGATVRIERHGAGAASAIEGTAIDVDGEGRLVVEVDGERHVLSAGDVVRLRGVCGAYS